MDFLEKDLIILTLLDQLGQQGSWCGETHIQKSVYFLQEMLKVPLGFEFILYKHGPYSFELTDELTAIRANGFIEVVSRYPYGPSLLPTTRTRCLKDKYPSTLAKFQDRVNLVADILGDKKVNDLERLATALFVTLNNNDSSTQGRSLRINEIKPHISIEDAKEAVLTIDKLLKQVDNSELVNAS